jgi:GT2 family glycosyltransferase
LILIVDDGSTDDSLETVSTFAEKARQLDTQIDVIRNSRNLGFTSTANVGLQRIISDPVDYDILVLLNQDTTVDSEWLTQLQAVFEQDIHVGAVGCKIFYPDRVTLQHAGGYLVRPRMVGLHYGHHHLDQPQFNVARDTDFVTGAAIALRVDGLRRVGLFSEVFSPGYYEDVDLCVRMREVGWRVVYCPQATATHVESTSFADWCTRLALSQRNRIIFALHWMDVRSFRDAFDNDERIFLREQASTDDLRALAVAYGSVLLMLPTVLSARLPSSLNDKDRQADLIHLLANLGEEALHSIKHLR